MSTGRSEARRAERRAEAAAAEQRQMRMQAEERAKKERERAQKMFVRQIRARLGGGFLTPEQRGTLG